MVFLPKYSSVLSPVERFWSVTKSIWRKKMTGTLRKVRPEMLKPMVREVVEEAASRAKISDLMSSADHYLMRVARGELV